MRCRGVAELAFSARGPPARPLAQRSPAQPGLAWPGLASSLVLQPAYRPRQARPGWADGWRPSVGNDGDDDGGGCCRWLAGLLASERASGRTDARAGSERTQIKRTDDDKFRNLRPSRHHFVAGVSASNKSEELKSQASNLSSHLARKEFRIATTNGGTNSSSSTNSSNDNANKRLEWR